MGTTALRQLLKSFCTNLPWNYAVLWKLRHDGQMILSWQDGYCDNPKPRGPIGVMSEVISQNDAYYWETSAGDSSSEGYSIGQVVANMSHLQYALGDGVVGEVANTGNHFWVSYSNVSTGEVNSNLVLECPDEWLLQLVSGIKTILLVPVLPHGVMQLGSLEVVGEDLAVVAYIKERFTLHNAGGNTVLSMLNRDIQTQSSSSLTSGLMDRIDELSASTISPLKSEDSDTVDSVKSSNIVLSTLDHVVSVLALQDAFDVSGKDPSEPFESESENKTSICPVGLIEVSKSLNHSVYAGKLEMMESKLFGLSCLEEVQAYPQCDTYNVGASEEFTGGTMTSYHTGDSMEHLFQEEIFNNTDHRSSASLLNFPKDCELHKVLGPAFRKCPSEYLCDSFSINNTCSSSNLICNRNLTDGIVSTSSADVGDVEYLLEAVVANACKGADTSNICSNVNALLSSLEKIVPSPQSQRPSEAGASAGEDLILWSNVKSMYLSQDRSEFIPISASLKSTITTVVGNEQVEGYNGMQPRKGLKQSNVSKRRTKPSDNQRPRPRDRQLIQDRIKELRELVPNGVKCSIDGLLGRTIEHMLYLRSVTDQAEKLKQWVHHEVSARKDRRSSESKDDNQNGTTWAFEFGSELMVCPIVVEDLAYPGHLLIEMLCNEPGLFLEIAQVIRSMQLTILKGVMESRSSNTWAHFIVETSKGFHRTEIFWPLMHLLQRKRNPISSKI